jgi:dipeptide/tripeptide permease
LLLWARDNASRTLFGYPVPPDFFAALPAAFVLLFGPLLERFVKVLAVRGHAPSQAWKFTAGMLLCALAYGLMLAESLLHRGPSLANPVWLVACKVALAFGELLGVPVGLSLVERSAPCGRSGRMPDSSGYLRWAASWRQGSSSRRRGASAY